MDVMSVALAGLNAANAQFEQAAVGVIRAATPPSSPDMPAGDVVDLSAAIVSLLEARTFMETNVRVFQTADEMSRSVLDVMG